MHPIRVLELRSVVGAGGGPEKTILLGTAQSDSSTFDITVCYIRNARDPAFDVKHRGAVVGVDVVELLESGSFDPRIMFRVTELCRSRSIDIVHAHDYKTDLLALLLQRRLGTIPLATVHGWTGHSWRERRVYYPGDKWLLARFPRLIAVSDEIRRELIRTGTDAGRVTVILNGIDPAAFKRDSAKVPENRAALGITPGELVIGSIGRLEPQKRFDLLIEAVVSLRSQWPQLRLLIAGEGSERSRLEGIVAANGAGDVCRLLGYKTDVTALHHGFDLYVQSSEYEGTPNSVLEAMAMETPTVATDAGGTRELIESGVHGLIVPCGTAAALAEGIASVLGTPAQLAKFATAARSRVETELSFTKRMEKVERAYQDLGHASGPTR